MNRHWRTTRTGIAVMAGLLGVAAAPEVALAHDPGASVAGPSDAWHHWNLDPIVLPLLGGAALLYYRGVRMLWSRTGTGQVIRTWQATAFGAALFILFVALISPLDQASASLLSAHMVQHKLLILAAAPLIVLSSPQIAMVWGLPRVLRLKLRGWQRRPVLREARAVVLFPGFILASHAAALLFWHVPTAYDAAVRNEWLHTLEHFQFLGPAVLFWWVVLPAANRRHNYARGLAFVFVMMLVGTGLAAAITLAPSPWYETNADATAWGLTQLEDQQLAGAIMWVPGELIYAGMAAVLFIRWIGDMNRSRPIRPSGTIGAQVPREVKQ